MSDEWRVTTVMASPDEATQLLEQVGGRDAVAAPGCSFSADGHNVFGYAPSKEATEQNVAILRSALDTLGLQPSSVKVDMWLPDAGVWGDPDNPPTDGDETPPEKQGWLSTIVDGITGGPSSSGLP